MKIVKAKLEKGTYLAIVFVDGSAEVVMRYPHTEAPPKLVKAFMAFNHHICDLTEQYDTTGQPDYDNVACRGYSIKGEDEKEGIVLTGIRSLKSGKSITLNTPFIGLEIEGSSYENIKRLVEALDRCHTEITSFMENNKTPDQIQGKLFTAPKDSFVVKSEATATARGEHEVPPETLNVINQIVAEGEEDTRTEQEKLDDEMPLNQEVLQAANARKNLRTSKNK